MIFEKELNAYMQRKHPRCFWNVTRSEVSDRVTVHARRHDAEWQFRELYRIFDRKELYREICKTLDDLCHDPKADEWRIHQDYVDML